MATHVELYEALKPHIGPEAAEMIAAVVPPANDLATKEDLAVLEARLTHKLLALFIPLWVTMASMAIAIVGLVATRL